MKRFAILALVAIATAGACSSGGSKSSSTTTTVPTDWSAAGLKVADRLAAKVTAAHKACSGYTHGSYPQLSGEYKKKGLPLPAALAACTSTDSEDFTFEVFADPVATAKYVETKRKLLCVAAARSKIDYPGFPYVDGGTWIFEPDQPERDHAREDVGGHREERRLQDLTLDTERRRLEVEWKEFNHPLLPEGLECGPLPGAG